MAKYGLLVALSLLPSLWMAWAARGLPHLGAYHDDGIYWATAKSLATGAGYRQINLPGEPYQTKYPPLYSLMLTPAWWTSNPESVALGITWAMLPLLVGLSWLLFRRLEFGPWASSVMAAIVAINPHSQISATRLMADLPGACCLWGCLLLSRSSPLAAGFVAGLAFLLRTAFLPLVVLLPAWYAWRREWMAAFRSAAASIPMVLGWVWFTVVYTKGTADPVMSYYTSYLSFQIAQMGQASWLARVWTNLGSLVTAVAHLLLLAVGENLLEQCVRCVLVVAALTGLWRLAKRPEGQLPAAFLVIYSLELLVWYYEANPRFLYPLLPLLLAGFWVEAERFGASIAAGFRRPEFAQRSVAVVLAGGLVYLGATVWWQGDMLWRAAGVPMLERDRARIAGRERIYAWVRERTPPSERFYSVHDPVFFLHTGRQALRNPTPELMFTRQPDGAIGPSERLVALAARFRLGYAVLTQGDAVDRLEESRGVTGQRMGPGFERVYAEPAGVIWKFTTSSDQTAAPGKSGLE